MARAADFPVRENVLKRGVAAAWRHVDSGEADASTRMYLMYALSVAGEKVSGRVGEPGLGLDNYGLALQALILKKNGEEDAARVALGRLLENVSEGGATAFWKGSEKRGWLGHSVEITAQAMRAMVALDPENPLLLKVINWLVQSRRGNYWASTKQTAMVVFAMTDYLNLTGEMNLDMNLSMELNGKEVITHDGTADWVTATTVALAKKMKKHTIVVRDGAGFYTSRILAALCNEAVRCLYDGAAIEKIDTPLSRVVFDWLKFYEKLHRGQMGIGGALHDPLALAVVINPGLIETREAHVSIDRTGTHTFGATVADYFRLNGLEPNVKVASRVDSAGFFEMLYRSLED